MKIRRAHGPTAALAALAVVAFTAGCGSGDKQAEGGTPAGADGEGKDPITIGFAIAKTGFLAPYDGPPRAAAEIAIDEINAKGGIDGRKLRIVDADTKSDQALAANAARDVIGKGAEIVVASCDFDYGSPAARVAQSKGLLSWSTCAGSLQWGPLAVGKYSFTMGAPAVTQGSVPAEWGFKEKGWRTAYVIADKSIAFDMENCQGASDRWEELGGKIVGRDTVEYKDTTIASQVTRLRAVNPQPDVVFLCNSQPAVAQNLRQIRGAGIKAPILSGGSFDGDYWKKAVPNVSDVFYAYYASIYGDDPDPAVNKLVTDYEKKTGEAPPTATLLTGYSVVQATQKALEATGGSTDGAKLAAAIEQFRDEPLLVGETSFDEKQHIALDRPLRIMQIQNGKTSYVTTLRPQSVPLPKQDG